MAKECTLCRHRTQCPLPPLNRNLALFFAQYSRGFREAYTGCLLFKTPAPAAPAKTKNESGEIAFRAIKTDGLNLN